jgi:hypothetical protein
VKGICSPRTRKQCRSGLHIWSRNWSKYSCARIKGHSKNFSNPLVAKDARTAGLHWPQHLAAATSLAHAIAHPWSLLATCTQHRVLYQLCKHQMHQKDSLFYPSKLASKARFYHPQARTHAHLFTIQARTYARLFFPQARS